MSKDEYRPRIFVKNVDDTPSMVGLDMIGQAKTKFSQFAEGQEFAKKTQMFADGSEIIFKKIGDNEKVTIITPLEEKPAPVEKRWQGKRGRYRTPVPVPETYPSGDSMGDQVGWQICTRDFSRIKYKRVDPDYIGHNPLISYEIDYLAAKGRWYRQWQRTDGKWREIHTVKELQLERIDQLENYGSGDPEYSGDSVIGDWVPGNWSAYTNCVFLTSPPIGSPDDPIPHCLYAWGESIFLCSGVFSFNPNPPYDEKHYCLGPNQPAIFDPDGFGGLNSKACQRKVSLYTQNSTWSWVGYDPDWEDILYTFMTGQGHSNYEQTEERWAPHSGDGAGEIVTRNRYSVLYGPECQQLRYAISGDLAGTWAGAFCQESERVTDYLDYEFYDHYPSGS
jgi:hypothetical protein